jgi:hypothetical protein
MSMNVEISEDLFELTKIRKVEPLLTLFRVQFNMLAILRIGRCKLRAKKNGVSSFPMTHHLGKAEVETAIYQMAENGNITCFKIEDYSGCQLLEVINLCTKIQITQTWCQLERRFHEHYNNTNNTQNTYPKGLQILHKFGYMNKG